LNHQESIKKHQRERVKHQDLIYKNLEEEHMRTAEERRQAYFDNMRKYQE
jgi:hypothetical protein